MELTVIKPVALVTGASREQGLGFEVARQLAMQNMRVILSARNLDVAKAGAARLSREGLDVDYMSLDVSDTASIKDCVRTIDNAYGRLDVLVNNAGAGFNPEEQASTVDANAVREALAVNLEGPWQLTTAVLPLLQRSAAARVVNISSQAASFVNPWGPFGSAGNLSAYVVSKAALNSMTRKMAFALQSERILVNAVCPGWIATYPGAAEMGARPVAEGAKGVVWAATLPGGGPTGGFFRDAVALEW